MKTTLFLLSVLPLSLVAFACVQQASEGIGGQESAATADASAVGNEDGGVATDAGPVADCEHLVPGPFQAVSLGQVFSGSEDFTFDGQGHIVGKRGTALGIVGSEGATTLAQLPGQTYGVRYHPNGNLIAAIPGAGKLVSISPAGQVTDLVTGLGGPNGIYIDFAGNIFLTEFGGSKVERFSAEGLVKTVFASGSATAQGADGIVVDQDKNVLFYTEYQKAKINRIDLGAENPTPVAVATIPGTALDGMTLDVCGNIYVVDNGRSRVYRVRTDATGAALGTPELLATLPTNVAAANFGSGTNFDPNVLYLTGNPGTVYGIKVGVPGKPVATPPPPAPKQPVDPPVDPPVKP